MLIVRGDHMRRYLPLAVVLMLIIPMGAAAAGSYKAEWAIRAEGAKELISLPDGSVAFSMGDKVSKADGKGNIVWEWASLEPISHIAADEAGFLYASSGTFVTKLGMDGAPLWSFDATGSVFSLQVIEGSIFVGWEYGLFTLGQDGKFAWDYYRPEDC
jgi:hypothetical protein